MEQRLKGGVGLVMPNDNLNGLHADVVSYYSEGEYGVKLRGNDKVIRLSEDNLVELSKHSEENAIAEKFRQALLKEAEKQSKHAEQRILAMRLADEFTFTVKYHTNPVGFDPLPEVQCQRALILYLVAYYVGEGHIRTGGRGLTSFHMAMHPFYRSLGEGRFTTFQATATGDAIDWCRETFRLEDGPSLLFRAFAFAQHRLDFRKNDDSLLDAFCVSFYAIQFSQMRGIDDIDLEKYIGAALNSYGKEDDGVNTCRKVHILWCLCRVFLKLAIVVRDLLPDHQYNILLPIPYGTTVEEQTKISDLLVQLRPDSPESYATAYSSRMDVKDLVPTTSSDMGRYMEKTYELVRSGKSQSGKYGDPLYQYTFDMLLAYWSPTDVCQSPCTPRQIKEDIEAAGSFRHKCEPYTPDFRFAVGKEAEGACKAYLGHIKDSLADDCALPKIDAYTYHSVRFKGRYYQPGGKYDRLACRYKCANCSKQLEEARACSKCGKVYYCTRKCQKAHYHKSHKRQCKQK